MKYTVEGVGYATHEEALAAAHKIHSEQSRSVQICSGDSTLGAQEKTTIGSTPLVADCEQLEPLDRTERLARRAERAPGTDLPDSE